ncbi:hypothetical protein FRB94_004266 [Tulasnella sp. JGI-2019a]|nr:hypothetical protein FRB93_000267 [Tulasnella sp. JGI-2019a]KAG9015147.1 hypothetical protein FRB94_004266 [Tulasnella sp. JGI-2019a]KAG9039216.1 hypothetical protein FRB95_011801 [Tulasnella sp. JGI-2019a]
MSRPYRSQYNTQATSSPSHVTKDLQQVVKRFTPSVTATGAIKISDVQAVASYSWLDESTPTVLVPGAPATWANRDPERVPQDSGRTFIDQNSARMGANRSPLTPIFAALQDLGKLEKLRGLDLVTDRNNLRKLLRWATRASGLEDFRIDVEVAGGTVLFTRTEKRDATFINGFQGYGHEYEKAATTQPLGSERATGHHRIISLSLGGIKVLLRFEVDACTGTPAIGNQVEEDTLTAAFASLTTNTRRFPGLTVRRSVSRTIAPQSTIIELKTRAARKALDWRDTYPQLYLSQTPYLYLAKHERGDFMPVERYEITGPELRRYAGQAEVGMVKLRDVLLQILEYAKEEGEGVGMSLVCQGDGLALYRRKEGTGRAVGEDILAMF